MCAVQGICTAGAFYFVNESDIVICSADATFFDSHVTYGLVSALEPVGLMRKVGLAETLRMALIGQRRAGHRRDRAAHRPGHRGRRARPRCGSGPTRSPPASPRKPIVGDPGHGPRDLGVARPALPRRHGAGPHLHPARQPDRQAEVAETRPRPTRAEARADDLPRSPTLSQRIAEVARHRPRRAGARVRRALAHVGRARRHGRCGRRPGRPGRSGSPSSCATGRRTSGLLVGLLRGRRLRRRHQPRRGASDRVRRRSGRRSASAPSPASRPTSPRFGARRRAAPVERRSSARSAVTGTARRPMPTSRGPASPSRC